MAFDPLAALDALKALVTALPGVQSVYEGVPESLPTRVVAYITGAGDELGDRITSGLATEELAFLVVFGYRVAGAEATAERTLLTVRLAFKRAYLADRDIGGTLERTRLDGTIARQPQYQAIAGNEYRLSPILLYGSQRETFTLNQ